MDENKYIGAELTPEQLAEFDRIKAYHAIERNSDALRFLVRQEARRIERQTAVDANPPASP